MNTEARIPMLAEAIALRFAPKQIILFGSHARGDAGPESDVDLLVIMPLEGKSRHQQTAEIYRQCHPGYPVDIVVRTPDEYSKGLEQRDWFLQEIARQGKVMYAA